MLSVQNLIREISPTRKSGRGGARPERDVRLRQAMDALPDDARLALALRCFERLPVSTVADVLGLDEESTHRLIEEAAHTVSRRLEQLDAEAPTSRAQGGVDR
jgi:DNA-directed RNA polymerase specialized sigma24 family protein